ncbi:MAG: hypothetical protein HC912_12645, partial [Saprospiraceae bacterium]|nr:hypothetical protein [Saprospiraceae bacterium]
MVHISRKLITLILINVYFFAMGMAQCVETHRISTQFGEATPIFTCPSDGRNDLITFQTDLDTTNYFFLFTNQNNLILDFRTDGNVNFERAPRTVFRVYAIAYEGTPTVSVGRNLATARLATGCFTVSENFIEINISTPEAGQIAANETQAPLTFCPNDPNTQTLTLTRWNSTAAQYAYLLINKNGEIISVTQDSVLDIRDLPEGNYEIKGLAYRGNLLNLIGQPLQNNSLATQCAALSENSLELHIQRPSNSSIAAQGIEGNTISACAIYRYLTFTNSDSLADYAYLVVNQEGLLIALLQNEDSLDVNTLLTDTYRVLGVAYINDFDLAVGDDLNERLNEGCYALSSNVLTLVKEKVEIGTIQTSKGETNLSTCGTSTFSIKAEIDSHLNVIYVLTNEQQVVKFIATNPDWDLALPNELSRVYTAVYTGDLLLNIGDTLSQVAISNSCFDVSDNFISVQPVKIDGGIIAFRSGEVNYYGCPGELGSNTLRIERSRAAQSDLFDYTYLTLDENRVIQNISTDGLIPLREEMYGAFTVRGVAHLLPLLVNVGDTLTDTTVLSTDCVDLSGNFL